MIGQQITGADGKPTSGLQLGTTTYNPGHEVLELWAQCQRDYQVAWSLQHRAFDEFDSVSLLQRAKLDQQLFGAFVGAQYYPKHKAWRWRGRKNTARNKLISILAHLRAGMLYPLVSAANEENEIDKSSARVMRILIENHLREAGYEMKFLSMVLSALVNPASIIEVKYLEAIQRVKQQMQNGEVQIIEAVDTLLSGLNLSIVPIDQFLITDFYTNDVQRQPVVIRVNRISWDQARKVYGTHPDFKYVAAGKTRVVMAGSEGNTLFDVEWTEGDRYAVQELTFYYRDEDVEATFVGGVFMGNTHNPYNTNPFKHRRMSLVGDQWVSIPVYPFAKMYFEPIDPSGRFFYGKSGAFKEYWDDQTQNKMHQLLIDGTYLDVFKPMFIQGLSKVDSTVIAPGAVIGIPAGSQVNPFSLGTNLSAAYQALQKQETDMAESTQDKIMEGMVTPGVTATQTIQAQNQARIFLGVFGLMVGDMIRQMGELVMDCTIQNTTSMEVDASLPESLRFKNKTILAKGKEKGKEITNKIMFTDAFMGQKMTPEERNQYEWKLWEDAGGANATSVLYHVNPYKFARLKYSLQVDPDQIINHAMGNNRLQKLAAFQMLTDPRVVPYTNQKAVVEDFVIEEYAEGDPDRYKAQEGMNEMMQAVMSMQGQGGNKNAPLPAMSSLSEQGVMSLM